MGLTSSKEKRTVTTDSTISNEARKRVKEAQDQTIGSITGALNRGFDRFGPSTQTISGINQLAGLGQSIGQRVGGRVADFGLGRLTQSTDPTQDPILQRIIADTRRQDNLRRAEQNANFGGALDSSIAGIQRGSREAGQFGIETGLLSDRRNVLEQQQADAVNLINQGVNLESLPAMIALQAGQRQEASNALQRGQQIQEFGLLQNALSNLANPALGGVRREKSTVTTKTKKKGSLLGNILGAVSGAASIGSSLFGGGGLLKGLLGGGGSPGFQGQQLPPGGGVLAPQFAPKPFSPFVSQFGG